MAWIEPVFSASISFKLVKAQSHEPPCSQESQAVCTKHVHGFGEVSMVAGSVDLR